MKIHTSLDGGRVKLHQSADVRDWQRLSSHTFVPLDCRAPRGRPFSASMATVVLGADNSVSRISSTELSVERESSTAAAYEGHQLLLMVQLRSRSDVTQLDRNCELTPGAAVLYDPRHAYHLDFDAAEQELLVITMDRRNLGLTQRTVNDACARFVDPRTPGLTSLRGLALSSVSEQTPPPMLSGIVDRLVESVLIAAMGASASDSTLVNRARQLMTAELARPGHSVAALSQRLHVSARTLFSAFEEVDDTPMRFLRRARIARARHLLSQTALPVSAVASECGFDDSSTFSRAFAREMGLSPRAFRQSGGGGTTEEPQFLQD